MINVYFQLDKPKEEDSYITLVTYFAKQRCKTHKVITHCKTEDMEDEFRYAYTLIIDKMMEVYTEEMEISVYKVVKFGEVSPDLGGLALN